MDVFVILQQYASAGRKFERCIQETKKQPCRIVVVFVKWGSQDECNTCKEFSKFDDLEIKK